MVEPSKDNLSEGLGIEASDSILFYAVTYFDWLATDFAVLDVALTANRQVENHRNLFPAIWAIEGMFHSGVCVIAGSQDPAKE